MSLYFQRFKSAVKTDERVCIMNEVINGIRVIKMYAWEHVFKKVVNALRKWVSWADATWLSVRLWSFSRRESKLIRNGGLVKALASTFGSAGILQLMQGLTFIVFLAMTNRENLTAQRVFSSLALLSLLRRIGGAHLIKAIFLTHEVKVAVKRLQVCELHNYRANMCVYSCTLHGPLAAIKVVLLIPKSHSLTSFPFPIWYLHTVSIR